jgi:hypothetical protein
MITNMVVVDDFYKNALAVREFALRQPFTVKGNFPGVRSAPFLTQDTQDAIQSLVPRAAGLITAWFPEISGSFQSVKGGETTWIHSDPFNSWAGVCYLTPEAPLGSGTVMYRHKATGRVRGPNDLSTNPEDWEEVDRIGNRFNRLVLYRGDLYHAAVGYFGNSLESSRLFQVFFFNTER